MKMASWSSVSEHLVNPIGMSDQLKWNNQHSREMASVIFRIIVDTEIFNIRNWYELCLCPFQLRKQITSIVMGFF